MYIYDSASSLLPQEVRRTKLREIILNSVHGCMVSVQAFIWHSWEIKLWFFSPFYLFVWLWVSLLISFSLSFPVSVMERLSLFDLRERL